MINANETLKVKEKKLRLKYLKISELGELTYDNR